MYVVLYVILIIMGQELEYFKNIFLVWKFKYMPTLYLCRATLFWYRKMILRSNMLLRDIFKTSTEMCVYIL
jgi:hypothetical protein